MSDRNAIKIGEKISLCPVGEKQKTIFTITGIIGKGASCIVYSGSYMDGEGNIFNVKIKEFFPYNSKARREEQKIINQDEVFNSLIERFEDGYKKQIDFQNDNETVNKTSYIIGIYEGNNTRYVVMSYDYGKTLTELISESELTLNILCCILLNTAKVVSKYHKEGYLHLDIKPDNIYVLNDSNEIKLFDFDSLIEEEELINNKTNPYISFTKEWASPELINGFRNQINIKSDFYSFGVIIFNYIYGRFPSVIDRTFDCGKWKYEYSANNKEIISRTTGKCLNDFLVSTLCANQDRRYKNDEDFIKGLEELIKTTNKENKYLCSNYYNYDGLFVGRNKELEETYALLQEKHKVFYSGIGGIGKSELAKKYADLKKDNYDIIIFGIYNESIKSFILSNKNFQIDNFIEVENINENYNYKLNVVNRISEEKKILIIIDNFDTNNDDEYDLLCNDILSMNCDFIVTTRNDYSCDYPQITVTNMDKETSFEIFSYYYKKEMTIEEEKNAKDLLEFVEYHTMLSRLLAEQANVSHISPRTMYENLLKKSGSMSDYSETFRLSKDGKTSRLSVYDHISHLFDLTYLDNECKIILSNMSLLNSIEIQDETLKAFCELDTYKSINYLCESGWLFSREDDGDTYLRLHPVITEIAFKKLSPSCKNEKNKVFIRGLIDFLKIESDSLLQERIEKYSLAKNLFNKMDFVCETDIELNISCVNVFTEIYNESIKDEDVECIGKKCEYLIDKCPLAICKLFRKIGDYYKKLKSFKKALDAYTYSFNLCKLNKEFFILKNSIVRLYIAWDDYDCALENYKNDSEYYKEYRCKCPEVIAKLYNTASICYSRMKFYNLAKIYCCAAIKLYTNFNIDTNIAALYCSMGDIYKKEKKYTDALSWYFYALNKKKECNNTEDDSLSFYYSRIGRVYLMQKKNEKALDMFNLVLKNRLKYYGEKHPYTAYAYNNVGDYWYNIKNYLEAIKFYKNSFDIKIEIFGYNHLEIASSLTRLAKVFEKLEDYETAGMYYYISFLINMHNKGLNESTIKCVEGFANVLLESGKNDEADALLKGEYKLITKYYNDIYISDDRIRALKDKIDQIK